MLLQVASLCYFITNSDSASRSHTWICTDDVVPAPTNGAADVASAGKDWDYNGSYKKNTPVAYALNVAYPAQQNTVHLKWTLHPGLTTIPVWHSSGKRVGAQQNNGVEYTQTFGLGSSAPTVIEVHKKGGAAVQVIFSPCLTKHHTGLTGMIKEVALAAPLKMPVYYVWADLRSIAVGAPLQVHATYQAGYTALISAASITPLFAGSTSWANIWKKGNAGYPSLDLQLNADYFRIRTLNSAITADNEECRLLTPGDPAVEKADKALRLGDYWVTVDAFTLRMATATSKQVKKILSYAGTNQEDAEFKAALEEAVDAITLLSIPLLSETSGAMAITEFFTSTAEGKLALHRTIVSLERGAYGAVRGPKTWQILSVLGFVPETIARKLWSVGSKMYDSLKHHAKAYGLCGSIPELKPFTRDRFCANGQTRVSSAVKQFEHDYIQPACRIIPDKTLSDCALDEHGNEWCDCHCHCGGR